MNKTTLTTAMDLLYRKYLIPMIFLDQEGTPLYPPLTLTAQNPLKHYLEETNGPVANLYHYGKYMLGCFAFQLAGKNLLYGHRTLWCDWYTRYVLPIS